MIEDIRSRLDTIDDLPTLPEVVLKLNQTLADKEVNLANVSAIIAEDPAITVRLLRLVNSVFFRRLSGEQEIVSVEEAVNRIGLTEINNLVFSLSVFPLFPGPWPTIDRREFWRHCLMTAITTRVIYDATSGNVGHPANAANVYYLAGLLHDIGLVAQEKYFTRELSENLAQARREQIALHLVEEERWGMNHGEIGAYLAFRWNLPHQVVAAINYHHHPEVAGERFSAVAHVVHLADNLCLKNGIGLPEMLTDQEMPLASLSSMHLDNTRYNELFELVTVQLERQDVLLDIAE